MPLLAPIDFTALDYGEWAHLSIAMSTALGSAREYAELDSSFDNWYAEMMDVHYDVVAATRIAREDLPPT